MTLAGFLRWAPFISWQAVRWSALVAAILSAWITPLWSARHECMIWIAGTSVCNGMMIVPRAFQRPDRVTASNPVKWSFWHPAIWGIVVWYTIATLLMFSWALPDCLKPTWGFPHRRVGTLLDFGLGFLMLCVPTLLPGSIKNHPIARPAAPAPGSASRRNR